MSNGVPGPLAASCRAHFEAALPRHIDNIVAIAQIPAPTFAERARAEYVAARFRALDLDDVEVDAADNAVARYPGRARGGRLVVSAHLDTVFGPEVDVAVTRRGDRLYGPGVGDNSTSVAGLLRLVEALRESGYMPPFDLWLLANSGEEGLGNLRGMRAFFDSPRAAEVGAALVLDGPLGNCSTAGIGSRRLEVVFSGPGGHSWKDFGTPSAVHALGRAVAAIAALEVPRRPKTTFNVGLVEGGISVNSIAGRARMVVDLRSSEAGPLARLEDAVRNAVTQAARAEGLAAVISVVGDRPLGRIPDDHPLVRVVRAAGRQAGIAIRTSASSTDANVPLARGVAACALGIYRGGGAHTPGEFVEVDSLVDGLVLATGALLGAVAWLEAQRAQVP